MINLKIRICIVFALLFTLFSSFGQNAEEVFGKNRVQYKQFEWKSMISENFELYYYGEGGIISKDALNYLEDNFDRITDMMGYPPFSKTKIFLYNSITDLQQSNIGIHYNGPVSGGETKFIKSSIEIAHPGTLAGLKEELLYKVTKLLLDEMLFGGSLRDMLQSNFMTLPEWLTEGAALYIAKGWTVEMDDYVREIARNEKNIKLSQYSGWRAALLGQSIWNYIAERHGQSNISSILNYIKIIRNEEKSIAITLGIPFSELLIDWKRFYLQMDYELDKDYLETDPTTRFILKNRKEYFYKNIRFSPDGMKVAYSRNDRGHYNVVTYDIATDEQVVVTSGGHKVVNQDVNYNLPLMAWVDDNTLGIIDVRQGKYIFWLYDVVSQTKIPRTLDFITEVNSLSFSENGRLGVISATMNGKSDLYLLSTRRDRLKQLTDDSYDDIDASFVPNTNSLIFSSNRTSDTLNLPNKDFEHISNNYNLFFYDLDTTTNLLKRVTNTVSKDRMPVAINQNEIVYLSDQKGIQNLFKYNISENIYTQLTRYKRNIKEFHYNEDTQALVFVTLEDANDLIYLIKSFDINTQYFTPPSGRQQALQFKQLKEKRAKRSEFDGLSMSQIIESRIEEKEAAKELEVDTTATEKQNVLNTEDYTFEDEVNKPGMRNSFLAQYRRLNSKAGITGPLDYETLFSADKLVTSFVIDPLRGFGMTAQTSMNDQLEDHHFGGGLMSTSDLRSGDVWGFYKFYKQRIDYGVRYDRNVIFWKKTGDYSRLDKYYSNQVTFSGAYPIDVRSRIELRPFLLRTTYNDLGELDQNGSPKQPVYFDQVNKNYFGIDLEYVYDNSVILGMNIKEGTRAKVRVSHVENLGNRDLSFTNVRAEVRHYQKIHREISIAGRIFYGSFFGNSPKSYAVGGIDNWLFSQSNTQGKSNPLNPERSGDRSDLLFLEYVSPIRGYNYAELYGNNALVFNAELRIPLMKYLNPNYMPSNFFRNIQFIGFYDFGSSWTGFSFLNPKNTISSVTVPENSDVLSPFEITIYNYKSPFLSSYGVGFRTMMLGYYTKFDVAWPMDFYQKTKPRLSVTIGFDF